MQALSTAVPGKWYTIKWMFGVPEVLEKLKEFKRGQRNPCDPE